MAGNTVRVPQTTHAVGVREMAASAQTAKRAIRGWDTIRRVTNQSNTVSGNPTAATTAIKSVLTGIRVVPPKRYYAAFSPHIIFMGIVYELRHSVCPEQFLPAVGQNVESAKAA